jgi:phosphatidate cytidylyltransferase
VLVAALLAALFFVPPLVLLALVAAVVALAGQEWGRLCRLGAGLSLLYGLLAVALYGALLSAPRDALFLVATLFWVLVVPAWLWHGVRTGQRAALLAAGIVVIVPTALAVVSMQPQVLLAVLLLVWIADIAAYFAGRAFGRRKLAPAISPGKTWEGVVAGTAGALAWAIICGTMTEGVYWAPFLAAAAMLAALSVLGDLFESAAKRQAGVKDSGSLLPGHGGILDRIDSMTAALPVAALLLPFVRGTA